MNEEYFCNYCRKGKIRPIQFSLKQAIINCDNIDCESYLEKRPWECIITKPLSESSSLCRYERDSVCSSDSSGVHSDLGSSNLSQSSMTDREVELLLQKNYHSLYSQHLAFECFNQHFSPWPSELKPTNQEPFVALDQNSSSSNEMSAADQNGEVEAVLNGACNEASNLETNRIAKDEFLDMLKDISFEDVPARNFYTPKNQVDVEDTLNQELESWLEGFQQSPNAGSLSIASLDSVEQQNGVKCLNLSPKALIPSIRSAFSEVSPSKINLKKSHEGCHTEDGSNMSPSKSLLLNILSNDTSFMSPASSGFSEENSGSEENSLYFNKSSFCSSNTCAPSHTKTLEPPNIPFDEASCIPVEKKENAILSAGSLATVAVPDNSHFPVIGLNGSLEEKIMKSHPSSASPIEMKNLETQEHQSPVTASDLLETKCICPTTCTKFLEQSHTTSIEHSNTTSIEHSDTTNISQLPSKPNTLENNVTKESEINSDAQLMETLNMLQLLKHCSSTSKTSLLSSSNRENNVSPLNSASQNINSDENFNLFDSKFQDSSSVSSRVSKSPAAETTGKCSESNSSNKFIEEERPKSLPLATTVSDSSLVTIGNEACSFGPLGVSLTKECLSEYGIHREIVIKDELAESVAKKHFKNNYISTKHSSIKLHQNRESRNKSINNYTNEEITTDSSHSSTIYVCQEELVLARNSGLHCDSISSTKKSSACDIQTEIDWNAELNLISELQTNVLDAKEKFTKLGVSCEAEQKFQESDTSQADITESNESLSVISFPDIVHLSPELSRPKLLLNDPMPIFKKLVKSDSEVSKDATHLDNESSIMLDQEAETPTSSIIDLSFNIHKSQHQRAYVKKEVNSQTLSPSSNPVAATLTNSSPVQIKIESLCDSITTKMTDSKCRPSFSSFSHLQKQCRGKTFFRGGFEVDRWSVPEVYIDELNIEVVVENLPGSSNDGATNTTITTTAAATTDKTLSNVIDTRPSAVPGIKEKGTEEKLQTPSASQSTERKLSSFNSFTPTDVVQPATEVVCKKESLEDGPHSENSTGTSSEIISLPQKINIYKPVTLRPEVLETEYFHNDAVSSIRSLRNQEFRRSVGYTSQNAQNEDNTEMGEDNVKYERNMPTNYFNLLLSNLEFDDNFCIVPPHKECDSSIENFVNSKFLFAEELSSGIPSPCSDNQEVPEEANCHLGSNCREDTKQSLESAEREDENAKRGELNTTKEDESDSDIPVVTINSDDELAIFIPERKVKESKCYITSFEKGGDNDIDSKLTKKDYHSKGKKRCLSEDDDFKDSKKLRSLNNRLYDQPCCEINKKSFPHSDLCFISNKAFEHGGNTNATSVEDSISLKPMFCNIRTNLFTMFNWHEKFGNLKMEPEFFDNLLDHGNNKRHLASGMNQGDCKDGVKEEITHTQGGIEEDTMLSLFAESDTTECIENLLGKKGQNLERRPKSRRKSSEICAHDNSNDCKYQKLNVPSLGTKWEPFSISSRPIPGMKNYGFMNKKQKPKNKKRTLLLRPNPTVPEVLQLLKESGWAVTPCNPVINYNVPPHAISPTIVPAPLESEYGETGSDVVLWALTDKEVSVPSVTHSEKNAVFNGVPKRKWKEDSKQSVATTHINQAVSSTKSLCENSPTSLRLNNAPKTITLTKKRGRQHSTLEFNRREKHIFPQLFTNARTKSNYMLKMPKREAFQTKTASFITTLADKTVHKGDNTTEPPNSVVLKTLRTTDGALYVRPCPSVLKLEETSPFQKVEEKGSELDGNSSDDCIELPDDFVAYEVALKEGYQVEAPPTLPQNVFIPPPPPPLPKPKQKKQAPKLPHSLFPKSSFSFPPQLPKVEDATQTKAEEELSSIVSRRAPDEVPDFVCMTIDGKMYVYHRKN